MLRVLYCENRSCGKQIKPVVIGGKWWGRILAFHEPNEEHAHTAAQKVE